MRRKREGGSAVEILNTGRFWHPRSLLVVQSGPKILTSLDAELPHGLPIESRFTWASELIFLLAEEGFFAGKQQAFVEGGFDEFFFHFGEAFGVFFDAGEEAFHAAARDVGGEG